MKKHKPLILTKPHYTVKETMNIIGMSRDYVNNNCMVHAVKNRKCPMIPRDEILRLMGEEYEWIGK